MWRIVISSTVLFVFTACATLPDGPATWEEVRWGGIVRQELDNSCSIASLVTVMREHFGDTRYDERNLLKKYIEMTAEETLLVAMKDGLSLLELEKLAQSVGYTTRRQMFTLEELERIVQFVPVIVYLEIGRFRHFAVVRGVDEREVWLADSSRGNVHHTHEQFLSEWRTPKDLQDQWKHPGGLIVVRSEGDFILKLLKEPQSINPPSLRELRRHMLFR